MRKILFFILLHLSILGNAASLPIPSEIINFDGNQEDKEKVDSFFITNIQKMKSFLGKKHTKRIVSKELYINEESLITFYLFFEDIADYSIIDLHYRENFLFKVDIDYIENWYKKYGPKIKWEMIKTIYNSYIDLQYQIDLSDEELLTNYYNYKTKLESYKKEIYGF